jgi:hypothetical protein
VPICDIVLAGCHKWLQAYHPLGLACFGRPQTRGYIEAELKREFGRTLPSDPLLHFVTQLENGRLTRFSETVPLVPLFTAAGAVSDHWTRRRDLGRSLRRRQANAERIAKAAVCRQWQPLRSVQSMGSGVLLLQAARPDFRRLPPGELRDRLCNAGLVVSAYRGGLVRLSLPEEMMTDSRFRYVTGALQQVGAGHAIHAKRHGIPL